MTDEFDGQELDLVAWETCWNMRKWVEEGWSLRFIFNYALALHGSEKVVVGTVAVNKWLPRSIELFTEEFFMEPKDLWPIRHDGSPPRL